MKGMSFGNGRALNEIHLRDEHAVEELITYASTADVYLAGPLFTAEERFKNKMLATQIRHLRKDIAVFNPQELNEDYEHNNMLDELTHNITFPVDMAAINNCKVAVVDVTNGDDGTLAELGYLVALSLIKDLKIFVINSNPFDKMNFYIKGMIENHCESINVDSMTSQCNGCELSSYTNIASQKVVEYLVKNN